MYETSYNEQIAAAKETIWLDAYYYAVNHGATDREAKDYADDEEWAYKNLL